MEPTSVEAILFTTADFWTVECSASQFSVFLIVEWPFLHYCWHLHITIASHGGLSLLNITSFLLVSDRSLDLHWNLVEAGSFEALTCMAAGMPSVGTSSYVQATLPPLS